MNKIIILLIFLISIPVWGQELDLDKEFVKTNGIKSITEYSHKVSEGSIISSEMLEYRIFDKKGNCIEKYITHWERKIKYEYDSLENLIKEVTYDFNDSVYKIQTWKYDNNSRILKKNVYLSWTKKHYTYHYVYNAQGQNIEIYSLDERGEKESITTKKYHNSGELLEIRLEHKNSKIVKLEQYNKCGNRIFLPKDKREAQIQLKFWDSCAFFEVKILESDTVYYIENGKEWTKITEILFRKQNIRIFDNAGNLIVSEIYKYNNDSTLNESNIIFFNEQGQVIETKTVTPAYLNGKQHFKHEYYDNGLKKFVYSFNEKGIKTKYTEYKIEYY